MLNEAVRDFIRSEENISMSFIKRAKENEYKIYLYGAGNCVYNALKFVEKYDLKIKGILDTFCQGSYKGIPIIRFSDFLASDPDSDSRFLISAPSAYEAISETIKKHFSKSNICNFEIMLYTDFIADVELYRKYVLEHWSEHLEFSSNLADDRSREVLESVLKGRISGDIAYFQQCYTLNEYYPRDIVNLAPGEVMVELGANNGETLLDFIKRCPQYKAAYCFEPDISCHPALKEIQEMPNGRVYIIPKGAWDRDDVLKFAAVDGSSTASHILEDGKEQADYSVECTTVDNAVKEPVTYMKMDVEGAELRALHGAKRTITENRPTLAVCVYHRPEDILDIWNYLRKLVPEYRFYLRHHTKNAGWDTVLYAVAKK